MIDSMLLQEHVEVGVGDATGKGEKSPLTITPEVVKRAAAIVAEQCGRCHSPKKQGRRKGFDTRPPTSRTIFAAISTPMVCCSTRSETAMRFSCALKWMQKQADLRRYLKRERWGENEDQVQSDS